MGDLTNDNAAAYYFNMNVSADAASRASVQYQQQHHHHQQQQQQHAMPHNNVNMLSPHHQQHQLQHSHGNHVGMPYTAPMSPIMGSPLGTPMSPFQHLPLHVAASSNEANKSAAHEHRRKRTDVVAHGTATLSPYARHGGSALLGRGRHPRTSHARQTHATNTRGDANAKRRGRRAPVPLLANHRRVARHGLTNCVTTPGKVRKRCKASPRYGAEHAAATTTSEKRKNNKGCGRGRSSKGEGCFLTHECQVRVDEQGTPTHRQGDGSSLRSHHAVIAVVRKHRVPVANHEQARDANHDASSQPRHCRANATPPSTTPSPSPSAALCAATAATAATAPCRVTREERGAADNPEHGADWRLRCLRVGTYQLDDDCDDVTSGNTGTCHADRIHHNKKGTWQRDAGPESVSVHRTVIQNTRKQKNPRGGSQRTSPPKIAHHSCRVRAVSKKNYCVKHAYIFLTLFNFETPYSTCPSHLDSA
ncbi:hypothetical protein NFJ02_20g42200 [Pycnococcus provasolii]